MLEDNCFQASEKETEQVFSTRNELMEQSEIARNARNGLPCSIYSVFHVPYSIFRVPYSIFHVPYSVFRSVF